MALDDSAATRANLLAALVRSPAAHPDLATADGRPQAIMGSPDGTTLLVRNNEDQAAVIDAASDATRYVFDDLQHQFGRPSWRTTTTSSCVEPWRARMLTLLDPMPDAAVGHHHVPERR